MNLVGRFTESGRERIKRDRREAWNAIKEADPEVAELIRQTHRVFDSTLETLWIGDEIVYGEEVDYGTPCPLEYCMATSRGLHRERLREMPCIISGREKGVELHHCHGGSISAAGFRRGMGQKTSDWLLLPLHKEYHTGKFNPEQIGMETWETIFGPQIDHLRELSKLLGYDVIERARGEEGK